MHDDATEEDEGEEIRNSHERIHAVGDVPYQSETDDASYEDANDEHDAVNEHPAVAFEIFDTTLTIVAPTKDRTEGESDETEGEQWRADIRDLTEGCLRKCGAIVDIDIGISNDA